MADTGTNKKYYWLKLKRDFFKRHDIKIVEDMKNGKDYVLFYLKMLVESIDHEGELRFNETIPYNEQMLSVITNTNVDIVRGAMELFVKLKMIEVFDDHTIYMNEVEKMVGKESASAPRVRKHRANLNNNQLLLQCNTDVTKCNTEIDTELKKDTELDKTKTISLKKVKHKYGEYNNVLLTDDELEKLKAEMNDWGEMIERLSGYMESKGITYKSHLATMRNWKKRDGNKKQPDSLPGKVWKV